MKKMRYPSITKYYAHKETMNRMTPNSKKALRFRC
jgi:hypothetical protein